MHKKSKMYYSSSWLVGWLISKMIVRLFLKIVVVDVAVVQVMLLFLASPTLLPLSELGSCELAAA